ncbi:MAG: DUF2177 family protein [Pseudomonadota bacterium]
MTYPIAYVATTLVFLAIDFVWLTYVAQTFYKSQIGHLLASPFNLPAAGVFYLIYCVGIVIFAVAPALNGLGFRHALIHGALFGFFAYATYEMTNYATLRDWPLTMVVVDISWGVVLTGASAALGYLIASRVLGLVGQSAG